MKASLTRYSLYLLFFLLCSCAKDKDFPNELGYPYLEIQHATPDSTGIQVSASIKLRGKSTPTAYGFAYRLASAREQQEEIRVPATIADNNFNAFLTNSLYKGKKYSVRAYAVVGSKTVYSPEATVTSLVTSGPVITDFSPEEGGDYTSITINGSSFSTEWYRVEVWIGPVKTNIISATYDKLVVKLPKTTLHGSYPIKVRVNGMEAVSEKLFTIWGPEILRMSKYEGVPGDTVTLFGNYLNGGNWGPSVHQQNTSFEVLSRSDTKLTLKVPFAKPGEFDIPAPLRVASLDKLATSPFNFTIRSNFSAEPALNQPLQYDYMPAFEADGKGYFFDYNRVNSYSTTTSQWHKESSFPGMPRRYPIWRRIGDKGYLIGGVDGYLRYGDVWEYDFRTTTWLQKQDAPFTVYNAASFVLDGKIYFAGGTNSQGRYTFWRYDPVTEHFTELNRIPGSVQPLGNAFTRNGKAYLFINGNMMAYNPAADSWETESQFGTSGHAFTVGNSEVYLLTYEKKAVLYHYQASTKTWEKVAFYPSCTTDYNNYGLRFSGFATSSALYVGAFRVGADNSCYNRLYKFKP